MRHGLPLWCKLNSKSKMALLDLLEAQGQTEFKEPLPIWREWRSDVIGICDGVVDEAIPEDFDYNKFMRQAPSRRRG